MEEKKPIVGNSVGQGKLSRRDFLRQSAALATAVGAGGTILGAASQLLAADAPGSAQPAVKAATSAAASEVPPPAAVRAAKSRVVVVTHPEVLVRQFQANRLVLEKMIESGVRELSGADSAAKAWAAIAVGGDRVSIKITRAGGPNLCTHAEIGDYLSRRLAELGKLAPDHIRVWDRSDLTAEEMELSDPYLLPSRNVETRFRAALVKDTTCIISAAVMKVHSGTGASLVMKNHFGSINNPSALHGWDKGDMWKSIAELSNLNPIKARTRLVILDATRPLYDGGSEDKPQFRWNFRGLILGTDPVAVESVALDILEKKRQDVRGSLAPLTDARRVLSWADKIGLGQADKSRIDLVRLDLD